MRDYFYLVLQIWRSMGRSGARFSLDRAKGSRRNVCEAYQSTHHQVTELNEGCAVSAIVSTLTGRRPMSEMKAWMAGW